MLVLAPLCGIIVAIAAVAFGPSASRAAQLEPDRADAGASPSPPSFMFEGLRSGEALRFPSPVPLPAGWQNVTSRAGVIDVHHPHPYRVMRLHVLRNDPHNSPRLDFRLGCIADLVGEQMTEGGYCPGQDRIPLDGIIRAVRLELVGQDAKQFDLSYRWWSMSTQDGEGEHL